MWFFTSNFSVMKLTNLCCSESFIFSQFVYFTIPHHSDLFLFLQNRLRLSFICITWYFHFMEHIVLYWSRWFENSLLQIFHRGAFQRRCCFCGSSQAGHTLKPKVKSSRCTGNKLTASKGTICVRAVGKNRRKHRKAKRASSEKSVCSFLLESQDSDDAVTSNFNRALYVCRIYRFAFEGMFSFHPNVALFDGNSPEYTVATCFEKRWNLMLSAFMEIFMFFGRK